MAVITAPDKSVSRVVSLGFFDGVHRGHCALIRRMREYADELGVSPCVVTFSANPLSVIAPDRVPPVLMSVDEKLRMLEVIAGNVISLNFTHELADLSAGRFLELLHHDYGVTGFMAGYDTCFGHDRIGLTSVPSLVDVACAAGIGIRIAEPVYMSDSVVVSSSRVRVALMEGNVSRAAEMLGRDYGFTGIVSPGNRIGRTLGYPTANVEPLDSSLLVPASGVYAGFVCLSDGRRYVAMINVGTRPTVEPNANRIMIEAHLLDYAGNLYGTAVTVSFRERIRSEMKFASLDELRRQLADDESAVRRLVTVSCNAVGNGGE